MVDCYEFFRAWAWEDIAQVEESYVEAKLGRSSIVAMAKERLSVFFGRTRYDTRHIAQHISTVRRMRAICRPDRMTHALQTGRQR